MEKNEPFSQIFLIKYNNSSGGLSHPFKWAPLANLPLSSFLWPK